MSTLFAAVELTPPNYLYLPGNKVFIHEQLWELEKSLDPKEVPQETSTPQYAIDEWGSTCYVLSFLIASATPEQRSALEGMLTAVGKGAPLGAATESELKQTLPQFKSRYLEFARSVRRHDVRVDFPEGIPALSAPVAASPDEVRSLMEQLCGKLHNCRK